MITTTDLYNLGLYEASYSNSRMRKLYLSEPDTPISKSSHHFEFARKNGEIIGVVIIERVPEEEHSLMLLRNPFSDNSKIESKSKKKFYCDGFFQVYVKPEHRGKGVATALAKRAIKKYSKREVFNEDRLPMIVAMDKAESILRKMQGIYVKRDYKPYTRLRKEIHYQTEKCMAVMDVEMKKLKVRDKPLSVKAKMSV